MVGLGWGGLGCGQDPVMRHWELRACELRMVFKVPTLLCFGTAAVEQAHCRCQKRRVAHQLSQKTQDSPVQSSPGLIAPTSPSNCMLYILALNVCTYCMLYLVRVLRYHLIVAVFVVYREWVNILTVMVVIYCCSVIVR